MPEILVEAHPHIGTNRLPKIITAIRECILAHGGQVHFGHRVVDILLERARSLPSGSKVGEDSGAFHGSGLFCRIVGLEVMKIGRSDDVAVNGDIRKIPAKRVILATGHSARDIFELLVLGNCSGTKTLRWGEVEHPQAFIDSIQYS